MTPTTQDALHEVAQAAARVHELEEELMLARAERNAAIVRAVNSGATPYRTAKVAGLVPSGVYALLRDE